MNGLKIGVQVQAKQRYGMKVIGSLTTKNKKPSGKKRWVMGHLKTTSWSFWKKLSLGKKKNGKNLMKTLMKCLRKSSLMMKVGVIGQQRMKNSGFLKKNSTGWKKPKIGLMKIGKTGTTLWKVEKNPLKKNGLNLGLKKNGEMKTGLEMMKNSGFLSKKA